MKYDEFAFFNQQLAAMLRDGIPLEGALRRLCDEMRRGQLRNELQSLEADLAKGIPLAAAINSRQLPELYKHMIVAGVKGGDLPGALTMLADYFHQRSNLWARMKGLMVYPLIVLFVALVLSCFLSYILGHFILNNFNELTDYYGKAFTTPVSVNLWTPPVLFGIALALAIASLLNLPTRRILRWRLPAFKEASLAEVASVIWLLLKNGVPLNDALQLAEQLESGTRAEKEIAQWRQRLAAGNGKFSEIAASNVALSRMVFPPLFVWTIAQAGEDLTAGFKRTAELYQARALYQTELFLYSALPCSILLVAALIISEIRPIFYVLTRFITALSGGDM